MAQRISIPSLLAHPWVLRDMPAALRSINAEMLAAAGGGQSRRQEAAAAAPAAGLKRHRSGELQMQVLFPHSYPTRCRRVVCRRRLAVVPICLQTLHAVTAHDGMLTVAAGCQADC